MDKELIVIPLYTKEGLLMIYSSRVQKRRVEEIIHSILDEANDGTKEMIEAIDITKKILAETRVEGEN